MMKTEIHQINQLPGKVSDTESEDIWIPPPDKVAPKAVKPNRPLTQPDSAWVNSLLFNPVDRASL